MIDTVEIKENAALVVKLCQELVDFQFGYAERSVEWLAGYIEQLKAGGFFDDNADKSADIFGCYLGEAIIGTYGGRLASARELSYPYRTRGRQQGLSLCQGAQADQLRPRCWRLHRWTLPCCPSPPEDELIQL